MSDPKSEPKDEPRDDEPTAADAGSQSEQDSSEATDAEPTDPADQLAAAQAQSQENWDKYLRANAELENVRRRAVRDISNGLRYAVEKLAGDLLPVLDSLELGLKSAPSEAGGAAPVVEGLQLTQKQLLQAMDKHGVKALDPQGKAFNPEQHEAVTMVPSDQVAPNHVLEVLQKGYVLNERLLRPAMVVVAQAAPKAAENLNQDQPPPDSTQAGG